MVSPAGEHDWSSERKHEYHIHVSNKPSEDTLGRNGSRHAEEDRRSAVPPLDDVLRVPWQNVARLPCHRYTLPRALCYPNKL